jgi:hypothetical protein
MLRDYMELVYEKKFHELKYHKTHTLCITIALLTVNFTVVFQAGMGIYSRNRSAVSDQY